MRELSGSHSRVCIIASLAFVAALAAGLALLSSGCSPQDAGDETSVQTAQAGAEQETVQTAEPEVVESEDAPLTAQVEVAEIENMPEPEPEMPIVRSSEIWVGMYFEEDTLYVDDRFGYNVVIPAGFACFDVSSSEYWTAATFSNGNGGEFNIELEGMNNEADADVSTLYYNTLSLSTYPPEYHELLEGESAYVITGQSEEESHYRYYLIEYVGGPDGSVNTMLITYAAGAGYDDTVDAVASTFEPGDIWSEH